MRQIPHLVFTMLPVLTSTSALLGHLAHNTYGVRIVGKPIAAVEPLQCLELGHHYAKYNNDSSYDHNTSNCSPLDHDDTLAQDFTDPGISDKWPGFWSKVPKKLEVNDKETSVGEVSKARRVLYSFWNGTWRDCWKRGWESERKKIHSGGYAGGSVKNEFQPPLVLPLVLWVASARFLARDTPLEKVPRLSLRSIFLTTSSFRFLAIILFALAAVPRSTQAYPIRAHVKWAILLCKFSDSPPPIHDIAYFRDMFVNRGTGGAVDYWHDVSFANIDLSGSIVSGWHTMAQTQAEEVPKDRFIRLADCVNTAKNDASNPFTVPPGFRTLVITSPFIDEWGGGGAAFLGETKGLTSAAHEMGHGIGMIHSFSDDPTYRNIWWAQIGEYDDEWDLMSADHVKSTPSQFDRAPPGLNGFQLDRAGWLPFARTYTFGQDGATSATVTIAALNHPEAKGSLLVRVPFDPSDLMHYYTIELRSDDGWDAVPGSGSVQLHEIILNPAPNDHNYQSHILRERTGTRDPVTSLNENGVTITVNWVDLAKHQASVTITGDIAGRCLNGYVWREAFPGDHVCVTPSVRSQAAKDNAAAPSRRWLFGLCIPGYIRRLARAGDNVCVTPGTWVQTLLDNVFAASRLNPSRFVYGPTTCANGFVWREADGSDHVCVTPSIRTQTAADNAAAASRRNPKGGPFGPDTCLKGFVWREAFIGDHVCVVPSTRTQAAADNDAAPNRVAHT